MTQQASHEIEVKLRVPEAVAAAVEAKVAGRSGSTRTHLQASYLDTPDFELAAHGLAWRIRREGARWVQTLKAKGRAGDTVDRLEHNVVLRGRTPEPDATLHAGTEAGEQLSQLLATIETAPHEQYRTDVWRRSRIQRVPGGRIELAFDRGAVTAGDRNADICELEIELVSGAPHAVFGTARTWVERHGLWLDGINKSQRGVLLAKGVTEAPVVKATAPALDPDMPIDAAIRTMVGACLHQVVQNASAVAGGMGGHEHVHQARIGIRKVRTVLREFGPYSTAIDPDWGTRLGLTFARLGDLRDREVVLAQWNAALVANGAPPFDTPATIDTDPRDILREPSFSLLLLDLLEYAHGTPLDSTGTAGEIVPEVLARLHRNVRRRAKRFAATTPEDRHATRKAVKRLRYIGELTASLFRSKKVRRFLVLLEPAQDALGELNDLIVAAAMYRTMTAHHEEAWFAVGWLTAQEEDAIAACLPPLKRIAKADPFWE